MITRRRFIKRVVAGAAVAGFPSILPSRILFGANTPSNTVQIAQIGFGRIAMSMDVAGLLRCTGARIVAVADFDQNRAELGRKFITEKSPAGSNPKIDVVQDYRELLGRSDIDAISISTPDHWHAQPAVEAAFAGKHVFLQKPVSLTLDESRLVRDAILENKRVFLLGSQQRSGENFRRGCEYVRNGRIGKVREVQVGLPGDVAGGNPVEMPVPANLNYDMWLGSTPSVYYTEDRVHSQKDLGSRPGWLRCKQFTAGMITGWGAHHVDIAHWGMGCENTGPISAEGEAQFLTGGLWDVHSTYKVALTYADGTVVRLGSGFPNGVKFIGDEGWIFVSRGSGKATASDPTAGGKPDMALAASDPKLIQGEVANPLYRHSGIHHQNWIDGIHSGKETLVPVETAHRSNSACLVAYVAMCLGRKVEWDPVAENFKNDAEANALMARPERAPYGARLAYERLKAAKKQS